MPNPPIVKDEAGEVLTLSPRDVMPGVEVFGQHEISELTKSPEKLTLLLERFVDRDPSLSGRKSKVRLELERSRSRIMDADFAAETANLTKAQILQQAGVAVLAQANAAPQTVLGLLQ